MNNLIKKNILNKISLNNHDKFALIIGASPSKGARSPKLWNSAYKFFKKDIKMYPADVNENNLKKLCANLKLNKNFLGSSVTIPFKEKVLNYLDFVESNANKIGSVNTIVKKDRKLLGYNTDYYGFLYTLKKTKIERKNKKILILGCGGAGKSCIVSVLNYFKKSKVFIFNRSQNKLKIFLKKIEKIKGNKIFKMKSYKDIKKLKKIDLIVNSTSVGFKNWQIKKKKYFNLINYSPLSEAKVFSINKKNHEFFLKKNKKNIEKNIFLSIKFLSQIRKTILIDIIYDPYATTFSKLGSLLGYKNFNGLDMNLMQAVEGFRLVNYNIKSKKRILKGMQNG